MKVRYGAALLLLAAAAAKFGTPHILRESVCKAGDGGCAFYVQCTYAGLDGNRVYIPERQSGHGCPPIRFFRDEWPWKRR